MVQTIISLWSLVLGAARAARGHVADLKRAHDGACEVNIRCSWNTAQSIGAGSHEMSEA